MTPRLHAMFLAWRNRGWRVTLGWATAILIAWFAWLALAPQAFVDGLRHATVAAAAVVGIVTFLLTVRRKAWNREEAARTWTAALPVGRRAALLQPLIIETAPAWHVAAAVALFCPSLLGAVAVGAIAGLVKPLARPDVLPEGSRYVPHRRRAGGAAPRGSLSALGAWPIRQMFASARPKSVAGATVPVLLLMPMGSKADAALVALGVAGVIGAFGLLVAALASVARIGLRWLQPLPVAPRVLLERMAGPAAAVILMGSCLEAWLPSLLGVSAATCARIGAGTFALGMLAALGALGFGSRR